jgi:hypothetical protein
VSRKRPAAARYIFRSRKPRRHSLPRRRRAELQNGICLTQTKFAAGLHVGGGRRFSPRRKRRNVRSGSQGGLSVARPSPLLGRDGRRRPRNQSLVSVSHHRVHSMRHQAVGAMPHPQSRRPCRAQSLYCANRPRPDSYLWVQARATTRSGAIKRLRPTTRDSSRAGRIRGTVRQFQFPE